MQIRPHFKQEPIITKRIIITWLTIFALVIFATYLLGGFTAYTEQSVLHFEKIREGEYIQVPHPDYPIEITKGWRFPWQSQYDRFYVLPPFPEGGGVYYLPSGVFIINDTINLKGDEGGIEGQGTEDTILKYQKEYCER